MANPALLQQHVEALCQWERHYQHMAHLNRAADYIDSQWETLGLEVTRQPFAAEGCDFVNLITRLGPLEAPRFIIGAHYDVCTDNDTGINPGADDNASGIAGLLELTRLLQSNSLSYCLELVAFANEEPPFFRTEAMGSYVHAKSLKAEGVKVKGMISLEMLGYFTDAPDSQDYPLELLKLMFPRVGNFIALAGDLGSKKLIKHVHQAIQTHSTVPVESISAPVQVRGIDLSDHMNYRKFRWPAVMITDTAFYRNPHYHQHSDTPDTLDYRRMAQVIEGVAGFARTGF